MFRLTQAEVAAMNRSQIATGLQKHRSAAAPPIAFTEHGAIMAATILNSRRAMEMSIFVVREFVRLRELLSSNKELELKIAELEQRVGKKLVAHDEAIAEILAAIKEVMKPAGPNRRGIGFTADLAG
jgi:hypothetical protein